MKLTQRNVLAIVIVLAVILVIVIVMTRNIRAVGKAIPTGPQCLAEGGTYNPSLPQQKPCCSGLKGVLQNPGCAPGGCHYVCTKSTTKPASSAPQCLAEGGIYNPSIPNQKLCCKGLRGVLQNPGCAPGGCHYVCTKQTSVKKHK
jgi:hypothetical protein